jgi:activator of 2-hydroxyglutaryl-CoA dehydratase
MSKRTTQTNDRQKAIEQKKRLEQLTIHLKMNLVDLAKLSGLNKNTLYHVGSGEKSDMTERTASRIEYHVKKKLKVVVNKEWLLEGKGEMIIEETPSPSQETKTVEKSTEQDIDWREKYYSLLEKYVKLLERPTEFTGKHK